MAIPAAPSQRGLLRTIYSSLKYEEISATEGDELARKELLAILLDEIQAYRQALGIKVADSHE